MFVVVHVKDFLLGKEDQRSLLCPHQVQSPMYPIYPMPRIPNCLICLDQTMIPHTLGH